MATEKSAKELKAAIEADIAESNDSVEDAGTSSEQKSTEQVASNEGTTTEASPDNPSEGTPEKEEWVVPGRFRTHADVLKAYQEADSMIGRQSSEIQRLRTAINEPPKRGESIEEKNERLQRFAAELTQDPEKAIENIAKRAVGSVETSVKASEFKRAYESRKSGPNSDFAELEPIMTDIATRYGDMITANGMNNDPRLLDILHLAARGLKAAEIAKKAESVGIQKGEDKARQKGKARVEGASGTTKQRKIDTSKLSAKQMKELLEKGDLDINE